MRCIELAVLFIVSTAACAVLPPDVPNPRVALTAAEHQAKADVSAAKAKYTAALPAWHEAVAKAQADYAAEQKLCTALPAVERKPCRVAADARWSVTPRRSVPK